MLTKRVPYYYNTTGANPGYHSQNKKPRTSSNLTFTMGKPLAYQIPKAIYPDRNVAVRTGGWSRLSQRQIHTEKKVIDQNSGTTVFNSTGVFGLLNGCAQGTNNFNRIGRKIRLRSLQIRGTILPIGATGAGFEKLRLIIVYDKQANGATPTTANVIQSQNISGTTSSTSNDFINLDNRDRFVIIRDKYFSTGYNADNGVVAYTIPNQVFCVEDFMKLNLETIYNAGNAGTSGDIQSGALYVLFMGISAAGSEQYQFAGSFRTRFDEL